MEPSRTNEYKLQTPENRKTMDYYDIGCELELTTHHESQPVLLPEDPYAATTMDNEPMGLIQPNVQGAEPML